MIPFCGRCGGEIGFTDLLLYAPRQVVRHFVHCRRWVAWKAALVTVFPDGT